MKTEWIDYYIDKTNLYAPYEIDKDADYESGFGTKALEFMKLVKHAELSNEAYQEIEEFFSTIIHVVHLWYEGEIVEAQSYVDKCVYELKNGYVASDKLNRSPVLWGGRPDINEEDEEVQFFRARSVTENGAYKAKDMFHVPFSERSKAYAGRYSIPGVPCLYLGNTSYACWIELDRPSNDRIAISPVIIDNDVEILNLAVSISDLEDFKENLFDDESDKEKNLLSTQKSCFLQLRHHLLLKKRTEYLSRNISSPN